MKHSAKEKELYSQLLKEVQSALDELKPVVTRLKKIEQVLLPIAQTVEERTIFSEVVTSLKNNPKLDLRTKTISWPERLKELIKMIPEGATAADIGEIFCDSQDIQGEPRKKLKNSIRVHVAYMLEDGLLEEVPTSGRSKVFKLKV